MSRTKSEIVGLAERCEKATGPLRSLDAAIFWPEVPFDCIVVMSGDHLSVEWDNRRKAAGGRVPYYTASLDAAMTLVDEPEKGVSVWRTPRDGVLCCATVHHGLVAEARTMPLALCAAALRARATLKEDENGQS